MREWKTHVFAHIEVGNRIILRKWIRGFPMIMEKDSSIMFNCWFVFDTYFMFSLKWNHIMFGLLNIHFKFSPTYYCIIQWRITIILWDYLWIFPHKNNFSHAFIQTFFYVLLWSIQSSSTNFRIFETIATHNLVENKNEQESRNNRRQLTV